MNRGIEDAEQDLIEQDLEAREMWEASHAECKAAFSEVIFQMGSNSDRMLKNLRRDALAPLIERIVNDESLWELEHGHDNGIYVTKFSGMVLDRREFFRLAEQGAKKQRYNISTDEFDSMTYADIIAGRQYNTPEARPRRVLVSRPNRPTEWVS
jgi:hypothetical protein